MKNYFDQLLLNNKDTFDNILSFMKKHFNDNYQKNNRVSLCSVFIELNSHNTYSNLQYKYTYTENDSFYEYDNCIEVVFNNKQTNKLASVFVDFLFSPKTNNFNPVIYAINLKNDNHHEISIRKNLVFFVIQNQDSTLVARLNKKDKSIIFSDNKDVLIEPNYSFNTITENLTNMYKFQPELFENVFLNKTHIQNEQKEFLALTHDFHVLDDIEQYGINMQKIKPIVLKEKNKRKNTIEL